MDMKQGEGFLDKILESVSSQKFSPSEACLILDKMEIEREEILAILASLSNHEISVHEAKERIADLAAHTNNEHKI